jgi:hypothetical protein
LAARKYPDREFIICEEIRRTFKEVEKVTLEVPDPEP